MINNDVDKWLSWISTLAKGLTLPQPLKSGVSRQAEGDVWEYWRKRITGPASAATLEFLRPALDGTDAPTTMPIR
jgi:hypothetical protein